MKSKVGGCACQEAIKALIETGRYDYTKYITCLLKKFRDIFAETSQGVNRINAIESPT